VYGHARVPVATIISFRLGLSDGVSVVAETWGDALRSFGFTVHTVAGEGPVDRYVNGLAIDATTSPTREDVDAALADADLVVVENLCTIPMNLPASRVVAASLRGRPAILHHHDPPWQRAHHAHVTELPPDDPAWRHVTINQLTERELEERGITATTIYNGFDPSPPAGDRVRTRAALGVSADERLVAHPVRAIPRKDVPAAVHLAEQLGATYWLLGPAEDGYGPELERVLAAARCPVLHEPSPGSIDDAYAAADLVAFPSTWEGFGNPPIEASLHLRPVAIGPYAVGAELAAFGFRWFDAAAPADIDTFLAAPDEQVLEANRAIAREHFSIAAMRDHLRDLLDQAGWLP
jgi:glycosyltransferase involved in cell wall biosynthesis